MLLKSLRSVWLVPVAVAVAVPLKATLETTNELAVPVVTEALGLLVEPAPEANSPVLPRTLVWFAPVSEMAVVVKKLKPLLLTATVFAPLRDPVLYHISVAQLPLTFRTLLAKARACPP